MVGVAHGDLALSRAAPSRRRPRPRSTAWHAVPALRSANAFRYVEAREHAEVDSLTGLHNRRLFYEFLAREIAVGHTLRALCGRW